MREIEWHDVNVTRQISLGMVAVRFLSFLCTAPSCGAQDEAGMSGAHASGVTRGVIRKSGYYLGQRRIVAARRAILSSAGMR